MKTWTRLFQYIKTDSPESVKQNTVVKFHLFKTKHEGWTFMARFNLLREKLTVGNNKNKNKSWQMKVVDKIRKDSVG
eukprot:snap_masked-scaffold_3-processed-gene-0.12-mRNA-1 protein AED:1.00 eAED:1.00 QI:0/0/0/0/1/1/3/0/76